MIVPTVIAKGKLNEDSDGPNYFVMPKLDVNLSNYLKWYTGVQRSQQILRVFCQLMDILELVHHSKVVSNDLKPINIMVNRKTGHVTLIDFGYATTFEHSNGTHISDTAQTKTFQGNLPYAGLDKMNFFQTSRKDDIISCFYILMELLNDGKPIGSQEDLDILESAIKEVDVEKKFAGYKNYREKHSFQYITKYAVKHGLLNPFVNENCPNLD